MSLPVLKKPSLKIFASVLLLFNGTGAVYGGLHLILHPDGSSLRLPQELLRYSPFQSFLIPGIVLLTMNGIFSIITWMVMLSNKKISWLFVLIQGTILIGWISIQMIMIQAINLLHITLGLTGIILMIIGIAIRRSQW